MFDFGLLTAFARRDLPRHPPAPALHPQGSPAVPAALPMEYHLRRGFTLRDLAPAARFDGIQNGCSFFRRDDGQLPHARVVTNVGPYDRRYGDVGTSAQRDARDGQLSLRP
jgi:hypothetical protein